MIAIVVDALLPRDQGLRRTRQAEAPTKKEAIRAVKPHIARMSTVPPEPTSPSRPDPLTIDRSLEGPAQCPCAVDSMGRCTIFGYRGFHPIGYICLHLPRLRNPG